MNDAVAKKPGIVTSTTASAAFWIVAGADVMSSRDGPALLGGLLEAQPKRTSVAITACRRIPCRAWRISIWAVSDAIGPGVQHAVEHVPTAQGLAPRVLNAEPSDIRTGTSDNRKGAQGELSDARWSVSRSIPIPSTEAQIGTVLAQRWRWVTIRR